MTKLVILTGIRANNDLTIGNYFGAIMPMIDMATTRSDEFQVNLFVPDLHSFTTPIDHSNLQEQIWNNLRLFVAAGLPLDKPDIHIYRQSYIPAHSELTWILDCFTGFGEMNRMTQFKDKAHVEANTVDKDIHKLVDIAKLLSPEHSEEGLKKLESLKQMFIYASKSVVESNIISSVGLFNYPVLMAADILLYDSTYVPVGDDQAQHLEFTRDIAERMNNRFGELFTVPKPVKAQHTFFGKDQGLRIKDLQDPTKKMSKSDESGKGVIFLSEDPAAAAKKIMGAATDSEGVIRFDWDNQPGITNLLQLLALFTKSDQQEVNAAWEGKSSYGDLKKAVAEAVESFLRDLQAKMALDMVAVIKAKLETSEEAMNKVAKAKLELVQQAVGLRA